MIQEKNAWSRRATVANDGADKGEGTKTRHETQQRNGRESVHRQQRVLREHLTIKRAITHQAKAKGAKNTDQQPTNDKALGAGDPMDTSHRHHQTSSFTGLASQLPSSHQPTRKGSTSRHPPLNIIPQFVIWPKGRAPRRQINTLYASRKN